MGATNNLLAEKPLNEVTAELKGAKEKSPTAQGQAVEEKKIKSKNNINISDTSIITQDNENVKELSQESENNFTPSPENNEGLKSCTFLCNVDTKPYSDKKPTAKEAGGIANRTKSEKSILTLTAARLAEAVTKGYTFTAAALNGTKEENFISQQLAVIDIDNDREDIPYMTIDDAIFALTDLKIDYAFMYSSFSHTAEKPKFRIVIILDEVITDPQEAKRLNQYLISLFPQADRSCHNLDRLYFGTCHGLAGMVHNRTASITVPDNFKWEETKQTEPTGNQTADQTDTPFIGEDDNEVKPKNKQKTAGQADGFKLGQAYRDFDLLEYVERTTGIKGVQHGKDILITPCPICGHNDDFYIIMPEKNRYKCFSSSYGEGGNIFNYIKAKNPDFSDNQVRDYFKYDILGLDREADKKAFKKTLNTNKSGDNLAKRPYIYVVKKTYKNGEIIEKLQLDRPKFVEYFRENISYFFTENIGYSDIHMYIYADGVYKMRHPNYVKAFIENMLPLELRLPENSNKLYEALTHDLRYTKYELCNPEKYINFKNGLYNMETNKIEPHTPKILSTIQIPIAYNPQADYSKYQGGVFDTFINHHLGGDQLQTQLILEFFGVVLSNIPAHRYKKALLIVGEGNTGKTQLRKLAERLVGFENCHNVELGKLENNRFEAANLYNRRLSGSPDMSFMNIQELLIFKQLTGGDTIGAEFKGRNGFNFTFNGLLWYCANELPKFGGDKGDHTYERFCIVRAVGRTHKKGEQSINGSVEADPLLIDKLYSEAPYIVYRALQALKVLLENERYSETEKQKNELKLYKKSNSSIAEFVEECVVSRPSEKIEDKCTRAMINKIYSAWCKTNAKYYEGKTKLFDYIISIGGVEGLKDGYEYYKNYTLSRETKREFHMVYGYDNT